jgi:D-alanine-D-alanine ligase
VTVPVPNSTKARLPKGRSAAGREASRRLRVAIVYNEPSAAAAVDEADVLLQVEAVTSALEGRGHSVERIPCGLDLDALAARLARTAPDVVFNLAEGLAGHERLCAVVPSLLDTLAIPYTGCPAEALFVTGSKLLTKERLAAAALPTPRFGARWPARSADVLAAAFEPGVYIIKPEWEHGSVGMHDEMVVEVRSRAELEERLAELGEREGRACFAEGFVEGRELNLAILGPASPGDPPLVLPPAEIDFSAFPTGKPRIIGWAAKWDEGSFEYHNTPRRFTFAENDVPILAEASRLAAACWELFALSGYARVDFRVDEDGQPVILEVNSNPCLSPDAGFDAAVVEAGLTFGDAIDRIVRAAFARKRRASAIVAG